MKEKNKRNIYAHISGITEITNIHKYIYII